MEDSLKNAEIISKKSFKQKIKYFFQETFRPHSKEEYTEVFTRGLKGNSGEEVSKKLPWLYIRVLALNIILFAIASFVFKVARFSADYLTAILLGGLLCNIPLLIFFYELYPKRDLSLLKLFAVLLIGGVVSTVIITLGYEYVYSTQNEPNAWISTLWVGFWEEFVKGAVGIVAIVILKKKDPLCCFLIGFAVGTGYSFTEDLGYIYSLSRSYGTAWLVLTSVGRGLSCVCSHAPWTAMICWAFAKFKRPFISFRFWGVAVAMMALHYFADVPFFDDNLDVLRGVTVGWAIEAVVVISIFLIVFFALKSSFKEIFAEEKSEFPPVEALTESVRFSQAANLTAVLCAVVLSVFAYAGCIITVGEKKIYENVYNVNEFVEFVQDGLPLKADTTRKFNEADGIYSEFISENRRKSATQKVEDNGNEYYYVYIFDEDGTPKLQSVGVRVDDELYYLKQCVVYEDNYYTYSGYPSVYEPVDDSLWGVADDDNDGENEGDGEETPPVEKPEPLLVVSFFEIASVYRGYSVEDECFLVDKGKTEFVGLGAIIALSTLAGVTLGGGSAAYITLKIKARKKKDA